MDTYIVHAFYNADQVQGVLNAIVMLVGSGGADGDYLSLIKIFGIFGLLSAVVVGFVRARGEEAGMYLIVMAMFYATLFVPRVTVTIDDVGYAAGAPRTVAHVPLGLAFFASTTSRIGYWVAERAETMFSLPDDTIAFTKGGLMIASRGIREAQRASFNDPVFAHDMQLFMRDCINPELFNHPTALVALVKSRKVWDDFLDLGLVNPGRIVSMISLPAMNCSAAYTDYLGPKIVSQVNAETSKIASILNPFVPPAVSNAQLQSFLPAAEALIMTASDSAGDAIKQRMMINLLADTGQTLGQILNDPAAVQRSLAQTGAMESANSSYRVMAAVAMDILPIVRNTVELVIWSLFPIVLLLIIIAGTKGGAVLKTYVMGMFWVQLWAPLYAVVNYVGTMTNASRMKSALGGIDGIAIENAGAVLHTALSGEAVVGMLAFAVPLIAYALVKGGEVAMSGVASGMLSSIQSSASKLGGEVGMGNINAANLKWGTYSTNSGSSGTYSNDFRYEGGAFGTRDKSGNVFTGYPDGTQTVAMPQHNTPITGQQVASIGKQLSQTASDLEKRARDDIVAVQEGSNALVSETNNLIKARQKTATNAENLGAGDEGQVTRGTSNETGRAQTTMATGGVRQGQGGSIHVPTPATALANAVNAGVQLGGRGRGNGSGVKTNLNTGPNTHGQSNRNYNAEINKALEQGDIMRAANLAKEQRAVAEKFAHTYGYDTKDQGSSQHTTGLGATKNTVAGLLDEARELYQRAKSFEEASKLMKDGSTSVGYNIMSDPHVFSVDDIQSILRTLRNGTSEQRAAMLEQVAERINGVPKHDKLWSGEPAPTPETIKQENKERADRLRKEGNGSVSGTYGKGKSRVNASADGEGIGQSGVNAVKPRNEVADVDKKLKEERKNYDEIRAWLEQNKGQADNVFAGTALFANNDLWNTRNSSSYGSPMDRARWGMKEDMNIYLGQATGQMPDPEVILKQLGVNFSGNRNEIIGKIGAGPVTQVGGTGVSPSMYPPPGWSPKIPLPRKDR